MYYVNIYKSIFNLYISLCNLKKIITVQSTSCIWNCKLTIVVAIMMPIAHLVKVTLPNYLAGLPIPDSIGGWFRLGSKKLNNIITIYLII